MTNATARPASTRRPIAVGDRIRVHWKIPGHAPLVGVIRQLSRVGFYFSPEELAYSDDDPFEEPADVAVLWVSVDRVPRLKRQVAAA